MHECTPFISRQIFEMACFRCQVLTYFTCSLLEVFGTLMSEYAPHSEPVLSFEDSICAQLQEPPILMYLRGTHVSTCSCQHLWGPSQGSANLHPNPTEPANPPAAPKYSPVPGLGTMFCCTSSTRPYSPYKAKRAERATAENPSYPFRSCT